MALQIECILSDADETIEIGIMLYRADAASVFYEKLKEKGFNVEYVHEYLLRVHDLKDMNLVNKLRMLKFPNCFTPPAMTPNDIAILDKFISTL